MATRVNGRQSVHISEAGFFDVLEINEVLPLVSDSNARQIYDNFRNLTDAQNQGRGRAQRRDRNQFLVRLYSSGTPASHNRSLN